LPVTATPRVALVHDALINTGGAERVAAFMHETFPEAPVFTSVYLPAQTYAEFRSAKVHTLPGAYLAKNEARAKQLMGLWWLGFAQLDLSGFDVVLSSTTWGAKFIRPRKDTRHACYCYAPFRWLWQPESYSPDSLPMAGLARPLANLLRRPLRALDHRITRAIPRLGTTCVNMARAIKNCYGREACVIYAPIRTRDYDVAATQDDYYLCVSRLMSHKRLDLAVAACRRLGRSLVIAGDGPEGAALEALASGTTQFLGRVNDRDLKHLYAHCRAVLFPSHEDYGLVPLEAQASGRPVIAYGSGGALETIEAGRSGLFFSEQTVDALVDAIQSFERMSFDSDAIRRAVLKFDVEIFRQRLREFVLAR
jgi:glycosyltransferase involved in cell wall biosynthesis